MTNIAYATAQVPLNDDNSRLLGVGDRLVGEIYWRAAMTTHPDIWLKLDPHDEVYGKEVTQDMTTLYRAMLEPIAKEHYTTGSARSDATGRGRFDLIPYEAMLALAKRYEMGAVHFGARDWERGQPLSRLLSSMRRHAMQINFDFSEDHVGAVLWNAAAFATITARIEAGILPKELDDIGWFIPGRKGVAA